MNNRYPSKKVARLIKEIELELTITLSFALIASCALAAVVLLGIWLASNLP